MLIYELGHVFYTANSTSDMQCLTNSAAGLAVTPCDSSSVADGDGQSWTYNSVSNTIEFGHNGTSGLCLTVNTTTQVLELGSCDLTEARWSQYSECRLNTRERTGAMRLERFSDSGSLCLNAAGSHVMVSSMLIQLTCCRKVKCVSLFIRYITGL